MKKAQILDHWHALEPNGPLQPRPVPYKHEGSTYMMDGIRITGSQEWIDSVLSRLKDLLAHENGETRLQLNYQESKDRHTRLLLDSWNCYVQVHRRGHEAAMVNRFASIAAGRDVILSRGY